MNKVNSLTVKNNKLKKEKYEMKNNLKVLQDESNMKDIVIENLKVKVEALDEEIIKFQDELRQVYRQKTSFEDRMVNSLV